MKKVIFGAAFAAVGMLGNGYADASSNVGNTVCPVSGNPVNEGHTYTHNGKSYNLCCGMCAAPFAADPDTFAAIAEAEVNDDTTTE